MDDNQRAAFRAELNRILLGTDDQRDRFLLATLEAVTSYHDDTRSKLRDTRAQSTRSPDS
jgi:hypothetical protein